MIPQIFSYLPLSNFYTRRSCFSQRLTFNDPLTLTPNEKRKDLSCSLGSIYDPETYLLNICTFLKLPGPRDISGWLVLFSSPIHYYCLHPITINGNDLTSSFSIVSHHFSGSAFGFILSRLHLSTPAHPRPTHHYISRRILILQVHSNEMCESPQQDGRARCVSQS